MAIDFKTEIRNGILYVKTKGMDESLEEAQKYGQDVLAAALQSKCNRVLCDESELIYNLSTLDTYKLGEYLSQTVPALSRIALVCHPDYSDDAAFWETVVVNRGLTVKVFKNFSKAESWLKA